MLKNFYKSLSSLLYKAFVSSYPVLFLGWLFWILFFFFCFSFLGFFFQSDYFYFFPHFLHDSAFLKFSNLHIDNLLSQFYIYKFNYYSGYNYYRGFTLSYYPVFDNPELKVFKEVFGCHFFSIFTFPFFEDGVITNYDKYTYLMNNFNVSDNYINSHKEELLDFRPLFANYFLIDFFRFDFFLDFSYPTEDEIVNF